MTADQIEQRTAEWFAARRGRLTGSNIGAALNCAPYKTAEDLIRAMVRDWHGAEREFVGNVATDYGQRHEPLALMDYLGKTGSLAESCGFFVCPDRDWLGASPDGLIGDDGLVEVKCPYGLRAKKGADLVFKTAADQPHYYAQMQIEMLCTGRQWCDFYQWAPHGDSLERVYFDADWLAKVMPELEAFYRHFLAELDNPAHLQPKELEVNTLAARALLDEYDQQCAIIDAATAAKKDAFEALVELAKGRNALIHGRKMTLVERVGAVDYKKIPELAGVDLERYRKAPATFWRLS